MICKPYHFRDRKELPYYYIINFGYVAKFHVSQLLLGIQPQVQPSLTSAFLAFPHVLLVHHQVQQFVPLIHRAFQE